MNQSNNNLNYYEMMKKKFLDQPFSSIQDQHEFKISHSEWGKYCQNNQNERRKLYKCQNKYITLKQIKEKSFIENSLLKKNGKPVSLLCYKGDITTLEVDVIVNAANESLLGGGGVDKSVHDAAGPLLVRECSLLNGCEIGHSKLTKGYQLPASYVIHTVGPILPINPPQLKSCYSSSLALFESISLSNLHNQQSIAFPCISTGFYGYPISLAATDSLERVMKYIVEESDIISNVIFCVFKTEEEDAYKQAFHKKGW